MKKDSDPASLGNPFLWVDSLSYSKVNLIDASENPERAEKEYNPFIVNKHFSYFIDTVLYANELNRVPNLDKLLQYNYLLKVIKPRKRFTKWVKKVDNESLELVKEYFGLSSRKAEVALKILTPDQLEKIEEKMEKGGVVKNVSRKK